MLTSGVVILLAIGLTGCRTRSVDEASYVAKNERLLRTVPVYGHPRLYRDFSVGQTASDAPLGQENGPPYGSYTTWHYFGKPAGASCTTVGLWYRSELRRLGWHRTGAYGIVGIGYFRDHAFLYFDCGNSGAGRISFSLSADYNGH